MRARWLKPEFFNDRTIAQLGLPAAIIYQALWCMADDGGVSLAAPERIKGTMFMYWDAISVEMVAEALQTLADAERIMMYEIDDESYAMILTWEKHQKVHRPGKFRHPRPILHTHSEQCEAHVPTISEHTPHTPKNPQKLPTPRHLDTYIPRHLDTQTPIGSDGDDGEKKKVLDDLSRELSFAQSLVIALNQGMMDNPLIGERHMPVYSGHPPSVQAAKEIMQEGVDIEFAKGVVYEIAKSFKPETHGKQISSLVYCANGVKRRWKQHQTTLSANASQRPAKAPRFDRKINPGVQAYANASAALEDL